MTEPQRTTTLSLSPCRLRQRVAPDDPGTALGFRLRPPIRFPKNGFIPSLPNDSINRHRFPPHSFDVCSPLVALLIMKAPYNGGLFYHWRTLVFDPNLYGFPLLTAEHHPVRDEIGKNSVKPSTNQLEPSHNPFKPC